MLNLLLQAVRATNQVALAAASSDIAALLLDGGKTAHSLFRLPLNPDAYSTCDITNESEHAALIVWDEAPMAHRYYFEALDRTLCDVTHNPHLLFMIVMNEDLPTRLQVRCRRGSSP